MAEPLGSRMIHSYEEYTSLYHGRVGGGPSETDFDPQSTGRQMGRAILQDALRTVPSRTTRRGVFRKKK